MKKKKSSGKITKIKPFISKCNWVGLKIKKDDWKKFEKNNLTIALNISFVKIEKKTSCLCFIT